MPQRKIFHIDLDAFFCAVEELRHPQLRDKPFAVGGLPGTRGVISSCSYPARRFGVRSAMPTGQALRLCPQLIVLEPEHRVYEKVSEDVFKVLASFTPLIEKISIDEAFLDLSDLSEDGLSLAKKIQEEIRIRTELPCSIGVATNKLVAKIATDVGKTASMTGDYPRAIMVVPPGEEAVFLAGLSVRMLWGVGPKTAALLEERGIHTIGELANFSQRELVRLFGKGGYDLARHALGIDDRPVIPEHLIKSISQEVTFPKDIREEALLRQALSELTKQVVDRLRHEKLYCKTIRLKLRWPDFATNSKQQTLSNPTDDETLISMTVQELFGQLWKPGRFVRLLGVGVSSLSSQVYQLSLWQNEDCKKHQLLAAIDELRARYGKSVIDHGVSGISKRHGK